MKLRKWNPVAMLVLFSLLSFACVAYAGPGGFVYTGSMSTARRLHTATLLNSGMVLIAGGGHTVGRGYGRLASAELYNPATGAFTATGSLQTARESHTASLLDNGTVLIVGGVGNGTGPLASAELYKPATGTLTATGSMHSPRYLHTATPLNNGMVLIAGGYDGFNNLASAELYDPSSGTFTVTGSMRTPRTEHTATLLNNGMVLIAGGATNGPCPACALASAELYDPATGTFTSTGSLSAPRYRHTARLLNTGMVLIAGGVNNGAIASAELYNPATGTFTATGSLSTARYSHTATLLNNGTVLIAEGTCQRSLCATAGLYDLSSGSFSLTGSPNTARIYHTATLLFNGMVLVTGGGLASAELYQPVYLTPNGLFSISVTPVNAWLPIGSSLNFKATGTFGASITQTLASVTWSSSNGAFASITNDASNRGHAFGVSSGSATVSACAGSICGSSALTVAVHSNLIIGSQPTDTARSTFEKCDDSGNRLLTGNLSIPRADHSATLLNDGHIFVAGGTDDVTSWQTFDQNGNVLSSGLLRDGRVLAAATLLTNGNVFLAGGTSSSGTWEIRSSAGALLASGNLNGSRTAGLSAVTLKNGNIWISGSALANGDACTWEIHNINGGLVNSGSLMSCFGEAQVQVLGNGNVVLLGGGNAPGTYEIRSQTGAFVSTGSLMNAFNQGASSVLLDNGNVFIFGSCHITNPEPPDPNGCGTQGSQSTWEIRNVNGNFVSTGSLFNTRDGAGAAVLSNGNVFITGGSSCPACWEIRSQNGSLVSQGSLFNTRYGGHTLTHF
ncbi:MAG TPA: kelch repeat-containing protein [Candidatus Acidoferrum sp.]|nr:kelch repeat-containing protein [Candidatus Acidoferrum sp.]